MYLLIITSLVWGASFVLIKGELSGLDPYYISFIRLFLSLLCFLPFIKIKSHAIPKIKLMLLGSIQFGLMYIFYIYSYQYLKAHQIAVLTIFTPLFVILLENIFHKYFSKKMFFLVLINVMATGWLVYNGTPHEIKGIVLIQVSNLCFAFGQVFYRKIKQQIPNHKDKDIFFWPYLGAVNTALMAFIFLGDFSQVHLSIRQGMVLIYLGIIASGACFFFWNKGATRVPAALLAISNNLKIPTAILLAFIVLNESVAWVKISLAIILFVISAYTIKKSQFKLLKRKVRKF